MRREKMIQAPDDRPVPIRIDVDNMFQGYSGMKKIKKMNRDLCEALKKSV